MVAPPNWTKNLSKDQVKEQLNHKRNPIEIAVCDSSNYFNFGAVVRIAHNFLIRKIYAVDMPTGYYEKASMGTRKYENIEKHTLESFCEMARASNRNVVALERRPGLIAKCIYDYNWPDNPILFFGGEKFGVPEKIIKEIAVDVVEIPVYGIWNDFNVAVSAGIACYDWTKKNLS